MEHKANITIDKDHITVERMRTACGREIRVISVFPRHGSETVEDKLKALAELDFQQGSCARKVLDISDRSGYCGVAML